MSSLKGFVTSLLEHAQDAGKDIKQFPKDVEDSVRNGLLRQPQTLRDYNITATLPQKELLDTLEGFHTSNIQNIKSGIAEQLIFTMDRKNFPINASKTEKIYRETVAIESLIKYEGADIINKIQNLLDKETAKFPKEKVIQTIKEIFKESKEEALKSTRQKIMEWLPQENQENTWHIDNERNECMKTIDEAYELVSYKFAIRAYQLLCHEREKDEKETNPQEIAKEVFVQAKTFALKQSNEYTLQKLTPQDIFSLQIYNYNSNFWNTHVKDGNDINDLTLFKPHTSRPPKPENEPKKPQKSEFENVEDYESAIQEYNKQLRQRKRTPEYKKWNDWTEKTEWMKDILQVIVDLGPLKKISNGIVKRISAVLERGGGAGVQHTIEMVFRPNILEMSPEEEELLRHILVDVYYGGKKCFIVLNHETFANIPMTIVKFMQVAHEMNMENINEHFTTIIGPLLATNKKQNALLNSLSSILVTHPADNRIPGAKRISNHQQQNAGFQFEKDLIEKKQDFQDNPNGKGKKKTDGQIYFCAPSGTRDIVHYADDGIPQIFIPDASWGSNITTGKLIRGLHAQNPDLRIYAVSTNTTELKKPNEDSGVSPNNNKWNKNATVSMHLQQIDTEDLSTENIINVILGGVNHPIPSLEAKKPSRNPIKRRRNKGKKYYDYDENGKINEVPCATPLPTIIFQYLKKFTKTPEYAKTGKLPERFFDENGKLNLDTEEFKYLQEFAQTSEYSRIRKIPSRFFDAQGYINIQALKNEIESNRTKQ